MARMERSVDGGRTWQPSGVMRCTPGGADHEQSDKSVSSSVVVGATGSTQQLGTVPVGMLWLVCDLYFQTDASTCTVVVKAGSRTIWQGFAGTVPIGQGRKNPLMAFAGEAVTVVWGTPAAGTPNGLVNLGIIEQAV